MTADEGGYRRTSHQFLASGQKDLQAFSRQMPRGSACGKPMVTSGQKVRGKEIGD